MEEQIKNMLKDCPPEQKKLIGEMVKKFTEMVKENKTTEAMRYLLHMKKTAQEKLKTV